MNFKTIAILALASLSQASNFIFIRDPEYPRPKCPNLIVNGDFEVNSNALCPVGGVNWCHVMSIPGWTSTTPGTNTPAKFELDRKTGPWDSYERDFSLDLSPDSPVSLSQTISIMAGTQYTVSFALFGNPKCGGSKDKTGFVSVGQNGVIGIKFPFIYKAGSSWSIRSFTFNSIDVGVGNVQVTFLATSEGSCGPVIDKYFKLI